MHLLVGRGPVERAGGVDGVAVEGRESREDERHAATLGLRGAGGQGSVLQTHGVSFSILDIYGQCGSPGWRSRLSVRITKRQAEVLVRLAHGLTHREIAEELSTTVHTVAHHISALQDRLEARNRPAIVARAVVAGLLDVTYWPITLTGCVAGEIRVMPTRTVRGEP
ncbi:response regulator transcription factor [Leifsonia sp. P73]|uniref:response regulator transcription factor n=1 Tax=Leifsonia sp. P73 TaxID=3423959 RepID=UPI003DA69928